MYPDVIRSHDLRTMWQRNGYRATSFDIKNDPTQDLLSEQGVQLLMGLVGRLGKVAEYSRNLSWQSPWVAVCRGALLSGWLWALWWFWRRHAPYIFGYRHRFIADPCSLPWGIQPNIVSAWQMHLWRPQHLAMFCHVMQLLAISCHAFSIRTWRRQCDLLVWGTVCTVPSYGTSRHFDRDWAASKLVHVQAPRFHFLGRWSPTPQGWHMDGAVWRANSQAHNSAIQYAEPRMHDKAL